MSTVTCPPVEAARLTADDLMWDTEHFVRYCFSVWGDRQDQKTIMSVTRKIAATLALVLTEEGRRVVDEGREGP